MSIKVKRAASGHRKRISPGRSEHSKQRSNRSPWLTMLSEEVDLHEDEEAIEEDEELSGGAPQPLRIRRK